MKRLLVILIVLTSMFGAANNTSAQVAVGVSVGIAPPAIPEYVQPPCPVVGYMWTPGYWAWNGDDYYWVPGVWLAPPEIGFLWTPGWWGWGGGHYFWHGGYWGRHVGFYGGINYGFGYGGHGFYGGRWEGGAFRYNTAVWHVGGGFRNTYSERPAEGPGASRAAFNGGPGGIEAHASPAEESAAHENHVQPTSQQMSHQHSASLSHAQLASVNHGSPHTMARASVGGQRYNASGHTMSAAHPTNTSHASTSHSSNMQHSNGAQHAGGMQSHSSAQSHAAYHSNGGGHAASHGGGGHAASHGGGGGHAASHGGGGRR